MSLYECVTASWTPVVGGRSAIHWLLTLAYLGTAALSFEVSRRSRLPSQEKNSRHQSRFWLLVAIALLLLGINKQIDIQAGVMAAGRCFALMHGWLHERRPLLELLVVAVLLFAFASLIMAVWLLRNVLGPNILAVIGLVFVATFLVVRAASLRDLDELIGVQIIGIRLGWLFELAGIACIAANALRIIRADSQHLPKL